MEIMTTHKILQKSTMFKDKRMLLISRSTFAGSGAYAQHWLGDNHRTWQDMKLSIAGIMNFNMFGIPLIGADTCGFFPEDGMTKAESDEICGRWYQLSTFYPFAHINRNIEGGEPTEPYNLDGKW